MAAQIARTESIVNLVGDLVSLQDRQAPGPENPITLVWEQLHQEWWDVARPIQAAQLQAAQIDGTEVPRLLDWPAFVQTKLTPAQLEFCLPSIFGDSWKAALSKGTLTTRLQYVAHQRLFLHHKSDVPWLLYLYLGRVVCGHLKTIHDVSAWIGKKLAAVPDIHHRFLDQLCEITIERHGMTDNDPPSVTIKDVEDTMARLERDLAIPPSVPGAVPAPKPASKRTRAQTEDAENDGVEEPEAGPSTKRARRSTRQSFGEDEPEGGRSEPARRQSNFDSSLGLGSSMGFPPSNDDSGLRASTGSDPQNDTAGPRSSMGSNPQNDTGGLDNGDVSFGDRTSLSSHYETVYSHPALNELLNRLQDMHQLMKEARWELSSEGSFLEMYLKSQLKVWEDHTALVHGGGMEFLGQKEAELRAQRERENADESG